jgi:hypothetical protein
MPVDRNARDRDINNLSPAAVREAMDRLFTHGRFHPNNPHLTEEEIDGLLESPRQWPDKPVFHGLAPYNPRTMYAQGKLVSFYCITTCQ